MRVSGTLQAATRSVSVVHEFVGHEKAELAARLPHVWGMNGTRRRLDTRLDRTVAIKVLPAALAADPEF